MRILELDRLWIAVPTADLQTKDDPASKQTVTNSRILTTPVNDEVRVDSFEETIYAHCRGGGEYVVHTVVHTVSYSFLMVLAKMQAKTMPMNWRKATPQPTPPTKATLLPINSSNVSKQPVVWMILGT